MCTTSCDCPFKNCKKQFSNLSAANQPIHFLESPSSPEEMDSQDPAPALEIDSQVDVKMEAPDEADSQDPTPTLHVSSQHDLDLVKMEPEVVIDVLEDKAVEIVDGEMGNSEESACADSKEGSRYPHPRKRRALSHLIPLELLPKLWAGSTVTAVYPKVEAVNPPGRTDLKFINQAAPAVEGAEVTDEVNSTDQPGTAGSPSETLPAITSAAVLATAEVIKAADEANSTDQPRTASSSPDEVVEVADEVDSSDRPEAAGLPRASSFEEYNACTGYSLDEERKMNAYQESLMQESLSEARETFSTLTSLLLNKLQRVDFHPTSAWAMIDTLRNLACVNRVYRTANLELDFLIDGGGGAYGGSRFFNGADPPLPQTHHQ